MLKVVKSNSSKFYCIAGVRSNYIQTCTAESRFLLNVYTRNCTVKSRFLLNQPHARAYYSILFCQAKAANGGGKAAQQSRVLTVDLVLSRNSLGPSSEASVEALQHVHLDRERLSSIPRDVAARMTTVVRLHLQHNRLEDMSPIAAMTQLRFLTIAHNSITTVNAFPKFSENINVSILNFSHKGS